MMSSGHPQRPGQAHVRRRLAADVAACLLLLGFGVMKAYALAPALSDENIYFYMCARIAEGAIPYRDFFFAHPPFHLIPGALLMSIAGFSLPAAKAIPAVAAALAGLAVFRAARRGGPLASLLALVLFLFSYDLLRASSHYTGASEATALLAWALERALANRPRATGLLAASAALTAFYAIPAGVALLVWIALRKEAPAPSTLTARKGRAALFSWTAFRKAAAPAQGDAGRGQGRAGGGEAWIRTYRGAFRYAIAYAALFAGVNLICLALFRADYWDPVFRYHLMKPPGGEGNMAGVLRGLTRENSWLLWGGPAALAGLLLLRRRGEPAGRAGARPPRTAALLTDPVWAPALAGLLTATLHLAFFSLLTRVYTFYALPAFPALALAGGIAYGSALLTAGQGISRWLAPLRSAAARRFPRRPPVASSPPERSQVRPHSLRRLSAGAILLAVPLGLPALLPLKGVDAEEGEVLRRYTWRGAPLPDWTNELVRGLLWSDERVAGAWSPALTRYLWHESRHFTAPAALAERVKELTPRGGTVFGDSIAAPLVALLSGRRIALDHADTNSMRYRSGITPPAEAIAEMEREPPAAIVANARRGFFLVSEMREWVTSRYAVAFSFDDPTYGRYDLYLPSGAQHARRD